MFISSTNHEILLNYLGIIRGIIEKREETNFSISDLLFDITIRNNSNQILITLQNISNNSSKDSKYQSIIKEIATSLLSIKVYNELTKADFFKNIRLTIANDLQPTPQFPIFTNKFLNENLEQVDFNLHDKENKYHILLYINAPYNLYEKELKEIERQYKQFFLNTNYETIPLDLIIVIDGSDDEEQTSSSLTNYFTKYIQDNAKEINMKLRTNIFNDNNFYNDKRLHIYYVNSKDPAFKDHLQISKKSWLYALGIDMSLQYTVLSENISANNFSFFCSQLIKFQHKEDKIILSKALKRIRSIGDNINTLNYTGELLYDYQIKLIPCSNYKEFECKSIVINYFEGSLRTKEYLEIKKLSENFYLKSMGELKHLKTFSFVPGKECSNCKVVFKEDDYQYYCYWCKIAFCVQCIEGTFDESNNIDKYFHKLHNVMYFKTKKEQKDLEDLDEYKLGENRFNQVRSLHNNHSAICNGCEGSFNHRHRTNPRYVCITCRPGMYQEGGFYDFCYDCIVKFREKKGNWNSLREYCPEHDEDHHVYLLLICECGNYQDY